MTIQVFPFSRLKKPILLKPQNDVGILELRNLMK